MYVLHGKGTQAFAKSFEVLLGKHSGGNQDRHLSAIHDRFESRPQRHLGLAVTDITANEPIHGPGFLHIFFDCFDSDQLIFRLDVGESGLHILLPFTIGTEGVSIHCLTPCIQHQQIIGDLGHCLLGLGLHRAPICGSKSIEMGAASPGPTYLARRSA